MTVTKTTNPRLDGVKKFLIESILSRSTAQGITQKDLALALGTSQPRVSNMANMQIDKFSVDTLLEYAYTLDIKAEIIIFGE